MICKVCDIDNLEGSKFCIECGASTNNGKKQERIVSAEEMKQLLWSIDWEKIHSDSKKNRLLHQIKSMYKIWQNDPSYIPVIMAPTKSDRGIMHIQAPDDDKALETLKKDMISRMTELDAPLLKSDDTSSGGGLDNEGLRNTSIQEMQGLGINTINTTKIDNKYTVEERLKKNYYDATRDNVPCGVCGDMRCDIKHIPPIQQQYQEAFENIQKFRRKRYNRIVWGIDTSGDYLIKHHRLWPLKRKIPGTNVRKGIPPQRPEPQLTNVGGIRKPKKAKFPKFKPDNPRVLKKGNRPIPKKTKENPYVGRW